MFICERETERQSMSQGGAEREGGTESEAGSRLWAVSTEPDAGLQPTNREIVTWAKVRRLTYWATQVPFNFETSDEKILNWSMSDKGLWVTELTGTVEPVGGTC